MPDQLAPFNEHRFDECMLWFSKTFHGPLTQYQMVKLHVMADFYHVLNHGVPIIGGRLAAWLKGPVVPQAWGRLRRLKTTCKEQAEDEVFDVSEWPGRQGVYRLVPKPGVDVGDDHFSAAEIEAMNEAWRVVIETRHRGPAGEGFFHDPNTFIGKVSRQAGTGSPPIDWKRLIEAYDQEMRTDHAKVLEYISTRTA